MRYLQVYQYIFQVKFLIVHWLMNVFAVVVPIDFLIDLIVVEVVEVVQ